MKIRVEVVYALAQAQQVRELELEQGARVMDALAVCGLAEVPGGRPGDHHIGIWGAPASLGTLLRDRDRVEIYRELVADPKQARRRRATQQRKTTPGA
jgi:putative ubiquitin-RnfH superfamily antitoxin RatB of RatAB toxin-antitoxin module